MLQVYQILHQNYYEEFLQSPGYVRLLSDLGLLNPNQNQQQDSDSFSLDDGEIGLMLGFLKYFFQWGDWLL